MTLKIINIIDSFDINTAAESASNICRWRGRYGSLSVAEHLCYVCDLLSEIGYTDTGLLRMGLAHDLNECVSYGDIPTPYKPHMYIEHDNKFSSLREFEKKLDKLIYKKIWGDLPTDYSENKKIIKEVDELSKEEEKRFFGLEYSKEIDNFSTKIVGWTAEQAKKQFLDRFTLLSR